MNTAPPCSILLLQGGAVLNSYDIIWKENSVGKAHVRRTGLYYEITCNCQMEQKQVYRIVLSGSEGSVKLGICVPEGNMFILRKRIPVKLIGEKLSFQLSGPEDESETEFLIVKQGMPFTHLTDLRKMKMVIHNGQPNLTLQKISQRVPALIQQGSDRNPICPVE